MIGNLEMLKCFKENGCIEYESLFEGCCSSPKIKLETIDYLFEKKKSVSEKSLDFLFRNSSPEHQHIVDVVSHIFKVLQKKSG